MPRRRVLVTVVAVGVALAGCPPRRPAAAGPGAPEPLAEVWVDAYATQEGDGTEGRPYRTLGQAMKRGKALYRLRSGMYQGPFTLPPGAAIDGTEFAVLFAEGDQRAVVESAGGRLHGITLQGGLVGLAVSGPVHAEGVHLSGQRRSAVLVSAGELALARADVRAAVSEVLGVSVDRGKALITDSVFSGPFRRAVRAEGQQAEVTVERTHFADAVTAIHLTGGGRGRLSKVSARGGRGPAVFAGSGEVVEIDGLEVDGHQYALLARLATLTVRRLTSRGAEEAGVGLQGGRVWLEDLTISGSGPFGALDMIGGELTVKRFRVDGAVAFGIHVRGAQVAIADGTIERVAAQADESLGDAIHLRQAKGTVERVTVRRAAGIGLVVAEGSDVSGANLVLERCHWGGVGVETLSTFSGHAITVRGSDGAGLIVPSEATATLTGLTSTSNQEGAVFADCHEGARVEIRALNEDAPRPYPSCVRVGP
ncbi:MAG TPA: hypothetical protein VND93_04415 [Myxococcales bacterium]|nr:hypothetical protein [Myxococcales bacterium]